jgi:hypothetical protein
MRCPQCGFNSSKTGRSRRVTKEAKEEFVREHETMFKHEGVSPTVIWLARKELGYSKKTVKGDIVTSLMATYKKLFECDRDTL